MPSQHRQNPHLYSTVFTRAAWYVIITTQYTQEISKYTPNCKMRKADLKFGQEKLGNLQLSGQSQQIKCQKPNFVDSQILAHPVDVQNPTKRLAYCADKNLARQKTSFSFLFLE